MVTQSVSTVLHDENSRPQKELVPLLYCLQIMFSAGIQQSPYGFLLVGYGVNFFHMLLTDCNDNLYA